MTFLNCGELALSAVIITEPDCCLHIAKCLGQNFPILNAYSLSSTTCTCDILVFTLQSTEPDSSKGASFFAHHYLKKKKKVFRDSWIAYQILICISWTFEKSVILKNHESMTSKIKQFLLELNFSDYSSETLLCMFMHLHACIWTVVGIPTYICQCNIYSSLYLCTCMSKNEAGDLQGTPECNYLISKF